MRRYAKTVVSIVGAVTAALVLALADDDMSAADWAAVVLALVTAVGVYAVPNRPPAGEPARPDISEQGLTEVGLIVVSVLIAVAVIILIWFLVGRA